MSVNIYDKDAGTLTALASGQRTWVGTQAAYKAAKQAGNLPNNAIIAITDDEKDHNHYSTEETFTGMYWIDGKPIYRKVYKDVNVTTHYDYQVDFWYGPNINEDIDTVVNYSGVISQYRSSISSWDSFGIGEFESSGPGAVWNASSLHISYPSKLVQVRLYAESGLNVTAVKYTLILEYTKTTD